MRKEHRAGLAGFGAGSFFTLLVLSVLTGVGAFQANLKTFWSLVVLGGTVPGAVCLVIVAIESKEPDRPTNPQPSEPQPLELVNNLYGGPGDQAAIAAGFSMLTHNRPPEVLADLMRATVDFALLPEPAESEADYSLSLDEGSGADLLPDPFPEPSRPMLYGEDTITLDDRDPWAEGSADHSQQKVTHHSGQDHQRVEAWE